jgi:phosphatidylinositol-4-phosphate 3-kinase
LLSSLALPFVFYPLFLSSFQDKFVRQKALEWIGCGSSEFLFNLITQFVEALRYETFENSALAAFLLEKSTKDRRFAFELFWQLQHRIHQEDGATTKSPAFAARCHLLQQMLLELGIPSFENEIAFQLLFLERLDKIATSVKACADIGMVIN